MSRFFSAVSRKLPRIDPLVPQESLPQGRSAGSERKWPKKLRLLSHEEETARDRFMELWHQALPKRFVAVERFNHLFPLRAKIRQDESILEIGAGLGEHIHYEPRDWARYFCIEYRPEMAAVIQRRFPKVEVVVQDCQEELPFPDGCFDRVMAIHVFEHLPNLPAALKQIQRVLKNDGRLGVCIPCEGGLAYGLARMMSAKRLFDKHFPHMNYRDVVVANEHINLPEEILQELSVYFNVVEISFFPFKVPIVGVNLCIGLVLESR